MVDTFTSTSGNDFWSTLTVLSTKLGSVSIMETEFTLLFLSVVLCLSTLNIIRPSSAIAWCGTLSLKHLNWNFCVCVCVCVFYSGNSSCNWSVHWIIETVVGTETSVEVTSLLSIHPLLHSLTPSHETSFSRETARKPEFSNHGSSVIHVYPRQSISYPS